MHMAEEEARELLHEMRMYEANLLYALSALAQGVRLQRMDVDPPRLAVYHRPVILAAPTVPGVEHEAVASAYIGVTEALAAGTGVWPHALATAFHILCVVAARRAGELPEWRPRDAADVLALDKYAYMRGLGMVLEALESEGRPRTVAEYLAAPSLHKLVADVIVESAGAVRVRRDVREAAAGVAYMVLWHLLEAAVAGRVLGLRDRTVDVFGGVLDALEAGRLGEAAEGVRRVAERIAASVERRLR